jgi:hypothetical protein
MNIRIPISILILISFISCSDENQNPHRECRKAPEIFVNEKVPGGALVEIILESDADFWTVAPSYAVWARYPDNTEESIYVTCKAGKDYWDTDQNQEEGLPVWYRVRSEAGYTIDDPDLDAITTATPTKSTFTIHWEPPQQFLNDTIEIFVEANVPYDYNDTYDQRQGDNGQPSIIWYSSITYDGERIVEINSPIPIGHSDPSGETTDIYYNLNNLTTAVRIFKFILVQYIDK